VATEAFKEVVPGPLFLGGAFGLRGDELAVVVILSATVNLGTASDWAR
jgi:hypothetical protein